MSAAGDAAANKIAPDPVGSGTVHAVQNTPFTSSTSTLVVALLGSPPPGQTGIGGRWVTFLALDGACAVAFGQSSLGAAVLGDKRFQEGAEVDFWVPWQTTHMRIYGIGSGTLQWYVSS